MKLKLIVHNCAKYTHRQSLLCQRLADIFRFSSSPVTTFRFCDSPSRRWMSFRPVSVRSPRARGTTARMTPRSLLPSRPPVSGERKFLRHSHTVVTLLRYLQVAKWITLSGSGLKDEEVGGAFLVTLHLIIQRIFTMVRCFVEEG